MAVFQIAKNLEGKTKNLEECIYQTNRDLHNLLFYCRNHCVSCVIG